jgi:predicted NUDIX family phosphoesterase
MDQTTQDTQVTDTAIDGQNTAPVEKVALCISSVDELKNVLENDGTTIRARFYNRSFCEDSANGLLQIIPYICFYAVEEEIGKLHVMQYLRHSENGDDRLSGKTSIGFGGHIDLESDLTYTDIEKDNGATSYVMDRGNLINTIYTAGKREVKEELGIDVENDSILNKDNVIVRFFTGDQSIDVNKVHLAAFMCAKLSMDDFKSILNSAKDTFNKDEIEQIDDLSINIDRVFEEMNLSVSLNNISQQLIESSNLEDWSVIGLQNLIAQSLADIFGAITYSDVYSAVKAKREQAQAN